MGGQQILSSQIANDSVTRAAVVPHRFDQADILVDVTVGTLDFGGAQIQSAVLLFLDWLYLAINTLQKSSKFFYQVKIFVPL